MDTVRFKRDYLSLYQKLYRVAYYILENEADAEDALQELYLKLWKGRDLLDDVLNPQAYSVRLLKNICIDRIRSASHVVLTDSLPEKDAGYSQDDSIDSRDRLDKVLSAIKSLPERQAQILRLRLIEGKTYSQIARITGLNYLTIRVALSRARKSLKNKI
ncbi:MAG: sigma-70 family RNA polymerase sigma factor [Bacteroidales bacterium]|nr:sigma-70 family RNA polymerase sigma factor [Bacteroidales bacterium]